MNCRQDDIARIVFNAQFPENEGKLVHVDHPAALDGYWSVTALCSLSTAHSRYDHHKTTVPAGTVLSIADFILRPLRPGEGDDETLQWAGKPEECPF